MEEFIEILEARVDVLRREVQLYAIDYEDFRMQGRLEEAEHILTLARLRLMEIKDYENL